jgi:hypothetical protein
MNGQPPPYPTDNDPSKFVAYFYEMCANHSAVMSPDQRNQAVNYIVGQLAFLANVQHQTKPDFAQLNPQMDAGSIEAQLAHVASADALEQIQQEVARHYPNIQVFSPETLKAAHLRDAKQLYSTQPGPYIAGTPYYAPIESADKWVKDISRHLKAAGEPITALSSSGKSEGEIVIKIAERAETSTKAICANAFGSLLGYGNTQQSTTPSATGLAVLRFFIPDMAKELEGASPDPRNLQHATDHLGHYVAEQHTGGLQKIVQAVADAFGVAAPEVQQSHAQKEAKRKTTGSVKLPGTSTGSVPPVG